jgi:hypothetical protein
MFQPYRDLVRRLNSRRVRYLVIGGHAVAIHGVPRNTLDLHILIEPTLENAARVLEALRDERMWTAELTTPERMLKTPITGFNDRLPLDVMSRIPGVLFATAWKNRYYRRLFEVRVPFIGRRDLIRAKRASGRPQDLDDVQLLTGNKPSQDQS